MVTIVTSLSKNLWDSYAKGSLLSWARHIKGDYLLVVTVDGPIPSDITSVVPKGTKVISIDNIPDFKGFMARYPNVPTMPPNVPPEHTFRFDYLRFWPKAFSLKYASDLANGNPVLWLDADVSFFKDVTTDTILRDFQQGYSIVCLDRGAPWGYMDSGYFGFRGIEGTKVIDDLYNIYTTGSIFNYKECHDAWLLSRVLDLRGKEWYQRNVLSLSPREDTKDGAKYLNPMEHTWLKAHCVHFKGNRKGEAAS